MSSCMRRLNTCKDSIPCSTKTLGWPSQKQDRKVDPTGYIGNFTLENAP